MRKTIKRVLYIALTAGCFLAQIYFFPPNQAKFEAKFQQSFNPNSQFRQTPCTLADLNKASDTLAVFLITYKFEIIGSGHS